MAETSNLDNDITATEPEVSNEVVTQGEADPQQEDTEMNTTTEETAAPQDINLDGANDLPSDQAAPALETRLPAKKDVALREFLSKMDDYAPIVRPQSPTAHRAYQSEILICLSRYPMR